MNKSLIAGIASVLLITQLTACQNMPKNFKPADIIPVITGGGAAYACNQYFSDKSYRAGATLICGALGVLVGVKMKEALKEEREQVQLAEATSTTLTTGKKQTVQTEQGNTITTEIVKPTSTTTPPPTTGKPTAPAQPSTPPQTATAPGCGTVKQTVVTKDNQRFEDTVSACKKGDTWVAA